MRNPVGAVRTECRPCTKLESDGAQSVYSGSGVPGACHTALQPNGLIVARWQKGWGNKAKSPKGESSNCLVDFLTAAL